MISSNDEIGQLKREIAELRKALEEALETIKELRAQLAQNSGNSHWPSSRDKGKKRPSKSLRQKSDKKAGGQPGHEGRTLEFSAEPDRIEHHRPERCANCQAPLDASHQLPGVQRRQVIDIPPLQMEVVEHQIETLVCDCCGHLTAGVFPSDVTNPVQYGPRIKALAVYLKQEHFVPYQRTHDLICDLFGASISPGTLENMVHQAAQRLKPVVEKIKTALLAENVVHFDESGFYIGGERQWLHSAGSTHFTFYAPHRSRGRKATDAIGILPRFQGTAHHDHWAAYWQYKQCDHALCNAHLLRDLTAIEEQGNQPWASRFKHLLLAAKTVVATARKNNQPGLSPHKLAQVERIYQKLVAAALAANPPPPEGWPKGKRGRPRKTKARNLAERFEHYRDPILAFVTDFNVPFDNNLAERDIRMLKVQQKISGCFRSSAGADDFCTMRTYTSSLRKQGLSVWPALNSIFLGQILEPAYTPV